MLPVKIRQHPHSNPTADTPKPAFPPKPDPFQNSFNTMGTTFCTSGKPPVAWLCALCTACLNRVVLSARRLSILISVLLQGPGGPLCAIPPGNTPWNTSPAGFSSEGEMHITVPINAGYTGFTFNQAGAEEEAAPACTSDLMASAEKADKPFVDEVADHTTAFHPFTVAAPGEAAAQTSKVGVPECETPLILQQPSNAPRTVCPEEEILPLTVEATGTGLTYQWYANSAANTTGGTAIPGATLKSFQPPTVISGTRWYYVVVSGTCGSVTSQLSGGITVRPYLWYRSARAGNWNLLASWQQFNGQSWQNATSWPGSIAPVCTCGPAALTYAEIRTNHGITVNGNYSFGDITVQAGGTLIIAKDVRLTIPTENALIINGILNINQNALVLSETNLYSLGYINIFSGAALFSQSIKTTSGSININSGGEVSTDTLDVSGGTVHIISGGRLTCHHLDATVGLVIIDSYDESSGSLIVTGSAEGDNILYSRYLRGDEWQLVAAPVYGHPVSADWATANYILIPELDPVPPGPEEGGYTPFELIEYHEPTNQWVYLEQRMDTSGDFDPGRGFGIQRDGDGDITFTGRVAAGEVLKPVTRTSPTGKHGWNLTGNPYPSAISLEEFLLANQDIIDPRFEAVYFKQGGRYNAISGKNVLAGLSGEENHTIQAGQGFFIRAAQTGHIRFTPGMRLHDTGTGLKSAGSGKWPGIRLTAESDNVRHSTIVAFHNSMGSGFDPGYDIGLFASPRDPEIFTLMPGIHSPELTVQSLPPPVSGEVTIPVGIRHARGGLVTFSAMALPLPGGETLWLADKVTGRMVPIASESYSVWLPEGTQDTSRFSLMARPAATSSPLPPVAPDPLIRKENHRLIVSGYNGGPADVSLISATGVTSALFRLKTGSRHEFDLSGLPAGIYFVKITGYARTEKIIISR